VWIYVQQTEGGEEEEESMPKGKYQISDSQNISKK
jgi:hypothetical protein